MNREAGIKKLGEYRVAIDEVDRRIVGLLNERTRIVEKLGRIKEQIDMPVYEPKREDDVFRNISDANEGPLPSEALKRLFERIVDEMRSLQHMKRKGRRRDSGAESKEEV